MLKILFFILFIIPVCLKKNIFWMVQNLMFLGLLFIIFFGFRNNIFCLGLSFGVDLVSFGLILLSF
jgi:hypothetical protein